MFIVVLNITWVATTWVRVLQRVGGNIGEFHSAWRAFTVSSLFSVPVVRPKRCHTLSNPAHRQDYTVACLNYTLQTMMPLSYWPVMAPNAYDNNNNCEYKSIRGSLECPYHCGLPAGGCAVMDLSQTQHGNGIRQEHMEPDQSLCHGEHCHWWRTVDNSVRSASVIQRGHWKLVQSLYYLLELCFTTRVISVQLNLKPAVHIPFFVSCSRCSVVAVILGSLAMSIVSQCCRHFFWMHVTASTILAGPELALASFFPKVLY